MLSEVVKLHPCLYRFLKRQRACRWLSLWRVECGVRVCVGAGLRRQRVLAAGLRN